MESLEIISVAGNISHTHDVESAKHWHSRQAHTHPHTFVAALVVVTRQVSSADRHKTNIAVHLVLSWPRGVSSVYGHRAVKERSVDGSDTLLTT